MRWYKKQCPSKNELVVAKCIRMSDIGAYCALLEYEPLEAFIPITEVTKQRIRKISQAMQEGRVFVASITNIDPEGRYIDISKKHLQSGDIAIAETRFMKARKLHSIVTYLSSKLIESYGLSIEALYKILWEIHDEPTMDHLSEFLTRLPECAAVEKIRQHYVQPKIVEIRAEVELTCFTIHGIEGIKSSIKHAISLYPDIKICILASPLYLLSLKTTEEEKGLLRLNESIVEIGTQLRRFGGDLVIKVEPFVITQPDKDDLQSRMIRIEHESQEVSGDEDDDE